MKPRMRDQIEELERSLRYEQGGIQKLQDELKWTKQRVADLAAENETLRTDKRWLQQMHSGLLQSMRFSGPKVL
jgi:septal ring factor EnvC (AmiA/AmiB activator)